MTQLAYLNGSFCALEQAMVPIEDRGFQFADGVYEVLVFIGDHPLMLEEHLHRLANSCREIRLAVDWQALDLPGLAHEGVRRAGFEQTLVYIQLTRGVAARNHVFPEPCRPTLVMTFKPKPSLPPATRKAGIRVMTLSDFRWSRCHIKSIALLPNVLAKNEALARGYDDALFVGPAGELREASAANVFVVSDGRLLTPPEDHSILPGITRRLVLGCAQALAIPIREHRVTVCDLAAAQEMMLCSTTIEVLPVVGVDDRVIGGGLPGPIAQRLQEQMLLQIGARSV